MFPRSVVALPGAKSLLVLLFVLTTVRTLLLLTQTIGLALAIVGLWQGEGLESQVWWIFLFAGSFMCSHLIATLQDKRIARYARDQVKRLRDELLEKIFDCGPALTQQSGTGTITTTVLDGIEHIETYIRLMLPKLTGVMVVPVLVLVAVFVLDWVSGLVLLLTVPLIIVFMILLGKTAERKAAQQYKVFKRLSNHFIDSLRGLDTLKLFGISRQYARNVFKVSEQFRKATMATLRVVTLSGAVLDFFSTLAIAIVAVLLGVRLLDGSLMLLPALSSLILAPEYFRPIRDFAADYHASLDGKNALEAVQALLARDDTDQYANSREATEPHCQSAWAHPGDELVIPQWNKESCLKVSRLQFSQSGVPALSDVSFTVRGFSKVGIIGMSGAGKSTLINILSGFWLPDSAHIQLGARAITHLKHAGWQRQIVYLPQDPYIYHATLRENIVFYYPEASEAELEEAVLRAGLSTLIQELPEGLDTKIGEGARALSGGEAQRVALARAFINTERAVLIVDEPTAHLDIETELELKEKTLPLMQDRLVFFATHRLHWMKEMDYILVLEQGRIVEAGTAEELLAQEGAFAALVQQSKEALPWHT